MANSFPTKQKPCFKRIKRLTRKRLRALKRVKEVNDQTAWTASVVTQEVPQQMPAVYVTDDLDHSRMLGAVVKFMKSLGKAQLPVEGAYIGPRGYLNLLPWGRSLKQLIHTPIDIIVEKFHQHGCHPYVGAFLRALDNVKLDRLEHLTGSNEQVVAEFAKALQGLRAELDSKEMRGLIQRFERNSKKCYEGVMDMVRAVMARHAKVLSLRIDLSYRAANPFLDLEPISHEKAKTQLAVFIHHLRRKTGLKVVGYCWGLEYAPTAGHHIHVWVLLNGHHHQDAAAIGHQLGAAWSTGITEGQGRYYFCNDDKKRYVHLAVGMLHRAAIDWEGVHHIAYYITKPDFFIQYQPSEGGRTFGRACFKRY